MATPEKEIQEFALLQASGDVTFPAEEVDRVLSYFRTLLLAPAPPSDIPETIRRNPAAQEISDILLGCRSALQMAKVGDFSYKIEFKGFLGGALKALQANLNHVAWLTRCVAEGDLEQRMDFMGDFSDSFNSMVEQLAFTLGELKRKQESLEALTANLQQEVEVRTQTEKRLRAEEERWELAVQCSRDGIWEIDLETGKPPYYSPRLLELTGIEPNNLPAIREWPKFFHPDDHAILQMFRKFFCNYDPPSFFELDHKLLCANGIYRWFLTRGMLVKNPVTQKTTRIIGVTADIQERKEREERFTHRATHDVLTDLPNRVLFDDHLKNSVEFAKRNGSHLAVIMIDLDKFKSVNDALGHYAGDVLLIEVAKRMQKSIRESDMVSRFGGDEFAMILAFGKNEWQSITKALKRTIDALKKPIKIGDQEISISASFGISICPEDGDKPKQLMMLADEALYFAKNKGRNACAFWKPNKRHNVVRFTEQAPD
ncbi:MAG: diguanylate cyclase [Synergistaceae bacterium]|nr:diguanylate cyclase [Synergistaceae bacterium]